MQRRDFLKSTAITVFGAGLPVSGAFAQNRYAKYAGQTVTINIPAHPHYDAMMKIIPEFTKETGIKVDVVEYLGTESQVVGRLAVHDGQSVSAMVAGDAHALLHGQLGLDLDAEALHVFDAASGLSLHPLSS